MKALVLRDGVILTVVGLVLGVAGAMLDGRFLGAWLPRLVILDPLAPGLVAIALFLVARAAGHES